MEWKAHGIIKGRAARKGGDFKGVELLGLSTQALKDLIAFKMRLRSEQIRLKVGHDNLTEDAVLDKPMRISVWKVRPRTVIVMPELMPMPELSSIPEESDPNPTPEGSEDEHTTITLQAPPDISELLEQVRLANEWQPPSGSGGKGKDHGKDHGKDQGKDDEEADEPDDNGSEDEDGFAINVRTLTGQTITLDVEASDTINMVKGMIQNKEGVRRKDFDLEFSGEKLVGSYTLTQSGIAGGAELTMVLSGLKGSGKRARASHDDGEENMDGPLVLDCTPLPDDAQCVREALALKSINIDPWVESLTLAQAEDLKTVLEDSKITKNTDNMIRKLCSYVKEYAKVDHEKNRMITAQMIIRSAFNKSYSAYARNSDGKLMHQRLLSALTAEVAIKRHEQKKSAPDMTD